MKRLLVVTLVALLGSTALSACGGDDAVVTVNGHEAMTVDELEGLLDQVADADDLLAAQSIRGSGEETIRSEWVTSKVLYFVVQSELLRQTLAEEGVEVDDDAYAAGEIVLISNLRNPQDPNEQPVTVDQLPSKLLDLYRTYYARYSSQLETLGADLDEIIDYDTEAANPLPLSDATSQALQQLGQDFVDLRLGADVEIAPAWGRWAVNDVDAAVIPRDGPITAPTTAPPAVAVGG